MRALLGVNVLIALLDAAHVHHRLASGWLEGELDKGWASCPITLNGTIRVLSSPGYPGDFTPLEVATRLRKATAHPAHRFWPDDVDLLDRAHLDWRRVMGHRQITDSYLLALAVHHGGRLVTLDRRITPSSVPGAGDEHLLGLL